MNSQRLRITALCYRLQRDAHRSHSSSRRLLGAIPTLALVVALSFLLTRLAPGGPFDEEQALPPEIRANLEAAYGLDQPMHVQFGRYVRGLAARRFRPLVQVPRLHRRRTDRRRPAGEPRDRPGGDAARACARHSGRHLGGALARAGGRPHGDGACGRRHLDPGVRGRAATRARVRHLARAGCRSPAGCRAAHRIWCCRSSRWRCRSSRISRA